MAKWDEYGSEFMDLRAGGMSYRLIASRIEISVTTAKTWSKKHQVEIKRIGDERGAASRAGSLALMEKRESVRAGVASKMLDELETRDFKDISTLGLLRMIDRYLGSLHRETQPIRIQVDTTMERYEAILASVVVDES